MVGTVTVVGGAEEEIHIEVDRAKALARGLTVEALHHILARTLLEQPAGTLIEGSTEYILTTESTPDNLEELRRSLLPDGEGGAFRLQEIARIARGQKEAASVYQVNGKEAIGLLVRARRGGSPVTVSKGVRETLDELRRGYSKSLEFHIIEDRSRYVREALRNLTFSALLGGAAAFLVILPFLRSARAAAILVGSIPLSIAAALLAMALCGLTLNTISLGGLALALGMLIDSSTVVLENLDTRCSAANSRRSSVIGAAAAEMAAPLLAATLTSLVVFLPLLLIPELLGALYRDLALTVTFALLAAYLLSITFVPMLYQRLTGDSHRGKRRPLPESGKANRKAAAGLRYREDRGGPGSAGRALERSYARLLAASLRRPQAALLSMLALAAAAIAVADELPIRFMPKRRPELLLLTATPPPSSTLRYAAETAATLAERAAALPEVASTSSRIGIEEGDPHLLADPRESRRRIRIRLHLADTRSLRSRELLAKLRTQLPVAGTPLTIAPPPPVLAPLLGLDSGGGRFILTGESRDQLYARAEELRGTLLSRNGIEAQLYPSGTEEILYLEPLHDRLALGSQDLEGVSRALHMATEGSYPLRLTIDGRELDVRLRLRECDRDSIAELCSLPLPLPRGGYVATGELLELSRRPLRPGLVREQRRDALYLQLPSSPQVDDRAIRSCRELIQRLPYCSSASASVLARQAKTIGLIFAMALLLMYLLLGAQFESFLQPLCILPAIPFGVAGAVLLLYCTGDSLNGSSALGLLLLIGIVVNNSILLISSYRRYLDRQAPPAVAVYRGSLERLRPILITTASTVAALAPIAIDPSGASVQSSMARAVIGGLLCSTLFTLSVTPLVCLWLYRRCG
jgi:HAE1 family hydrophobic/amphiphilic exporter-1